MLTFRRSRAAIASMLAAAALALAVLPGLAPSAIAQQPASPRRDELSQLFAETNRLAQAGRYPEAAEAGRRAVEVAERTLAPDHSLVGTALFNLASAYVYLGRLPDAEPLFLRTLAIKEKAHGPDHADVATAANNLAVLYIHQGRYREAEPLLRRVVTILERALGPVHTNLGTGLHVLATALTYMGRHEQAEPLFRRALAIKEAALGPDHTEVGTALFGLASLLVTTGRHDEAEPLYRRTLEIKERTLGPDHSEVATALNNIAVLLQLQRRYEEAEPLYARILSIKEKAVGADHSDVGIAVFNLGVLHKHRGHATKAEELLKRALANLERSAGSEHPFVMNVMAELGDLAFSERRWGDAEAYFQRSTSIAIRRTERQGTTGQQQAPALRSDAASARAQFSGLIRAGLEREAAEGRAVPSPARAAATFLAAQWSTESDAARALAQMAARGAAGHGRAGGADGPGTLVRQRQDLLAEWQRRDGERTVAFSKPPERRDAAAEAANEGRLTAIDGEIAELDRRLAAAFPDYVLHTRPQVVGIEEVQRLLARDEALVLFLDTGELGPVREETLVWVVTSDAQRLVRAPIGSRGLAREVQALRCGLDTSAWRDDAGRRCAQALGRPPGVVPERGEDLPFDLGRAHALYDTLLGPVADLVEGRQLVVVPSGALNSLPLHALVTRAPAPGTGYADAAWLARRAGLTVLPSVASLKALRGQARASSGDMAFIGFGNPLLKGESGTDERAEQRQACAALPSAAARTPITVASAVRGKAPGKARGGLANVEAVRLQDPLPETADELCAVARASGATDPDTVVNLGARATEARVKSLSADRTLARARIVHFATHGLVAGETALLAADRAEPALLMTPPAVASTEDDGLLTASEVSSLALDADWVVLSACNTAAGDRVGGDALSGLARAFFYAGARALLVSHWYVDSDATVALVRDTFEVLRDAPTVSRAEALRRAMARLVDRGGRMAHPATWAAFVVVGEGGALR